MTNSLEDLLKSLPQPTLDHPLDRLEPDVWRRIQARGGAAPALALGWGGGLRFQLAAAAVALVIGVALGLATNTSHRAEGASSALYASYVASGPMGQLESGL